MWLTANYKIDCIDALSSGMSATAAADLADELHYQRLLNGVENANMHLAAAVESGDQRAKERSEKWLRDASQRWQAEETHRAAKGESS